MVRENSKETVIKQLQIAKKFVTVMNFGGYSGDHWPKYKGIKDWSRPPQCTGPELGDALAELQPKKNSKGQLAVKLINLADKCTFVPLVTAPGNEADSLVAYVVNTEKMPLLFEGGEASADGKLTKANAHDVSAVVIRGSVSCNNWIRDMDGGLVPYSTDYTLAGEPIGDLVVSTEGCKFHSGMVKAANNLYTRIKQALQEVNAGAVFFVGHSLGAGVAGLLSIRFSVEAAVSGLPCHGAFCFAMPKIGNDKAAQEFSANKYGIVRTVNGGDPVPHLPCDLHMPTTAAIPEPFKSIVPDALARQLMENLTSYMDTNGITCSSYRSISCAEVFSDKGEVELCKGVPAHCETDTCERPCGLKYLDMAQANDFARHCATPHDLFGNFCTNKCDGDLSTKKGDFYLPFCNGASKASGPGPSVPEASGPRAPKSWFCWPHDE